MPRNQRCKREPFSDAEIEVVWKKGTIVTNNDPNVFRKDRCGHWIQRSKYGDTTSQYGWEIDHIRACANGGTDDLANLQPLYWENNRDKGDSTNWQCP